MGVKWKRRGLSRTPLLPTQRWFWMLVEYVINPCAHESDQNTQSKPLTRCTQSRQAEQTTDLHFPALTCSQNLIVVPCPPLRSLSFGSASRQKVRRRKSSLRKHSTGGSPAGCPWLGPPAKPRPPSRSRSGCLIFPTTAETYSALCPTGSSLPSDSAPPFSCFIYIQSTLMK